MKQKNTIWLLPVLAVMIITSWSCEKNFNDLNQNTNKPTAVPPYLLVTGILNKMVDFPTGDQDHWNQYFLINYDYYGNNRYDFGSGSSYYTELKNVTKMEDQAKAIGLPNVNPYKAMANFFKAYYFTKMSLEMGNIPMTAALQGSNNLTPEYDSQKKVFQQSFQWLDSANNDLGILVAAGTNTLGGDIYFGGDLLKWQKTVNAFRLRLLINLSKKSGDADLNIASQFSSIINNPAKYPLFQSSDDNLQYTYSHPTNDYPETPANFGFNALRENCSGTYIGLLTSLKDPRVFLTADPATALVASGKSPTDFSAFVGADPGEDLGKMYAKTNAGQYSLISRYRYYNTYTGEPTVIVGYPELCFNIAEAINRGWITSGPKGNAETYYKLGMQASMASYNIPAAGSMPVYFLRPGASLGTFDTYTVNVDFNNYYNQPSVAYINGATGLTQILKQKYLALFRHSGLEAYFQFRRTGVPAFTTGAGTGNSGRIALRFQYPSNEITTNTANYQTALKNQFNSNDDINGVMWLLQ
ncbi:MAG: SusD/RagB family nutrient-binding outer membrane lipoprotein [Ginsengibacter sp.]